MITALIDRLIKALRLGTGSKKYLVNTSWLFLEQAARMLIGLFVSVWIIRYLGPDRYGILSYAQSLVILLGAVATLGVDQILIRELVKKEYTRGALLANALVLKLIGASAVLTILSVAINVTDTEPITKLLVLIIASGTLFKSADVIGLLFESEVRSKYAVSAKLFGFAVLTGTKIALLLLKAPLVAFAVVIAFESVLYAGSLIYYYRKLRPDTGPWVVDRTLMRSLLHQSWPLILSGIAIHVGMRIDQIMLKSYMDATSVGVYAAGVKLAEVFTFLPMVVGQSLFPKIVSMDLKKEDYKIKRIIRDVFYLLVGVALFVNLVSYYTVMFLYGEEYLLSYQVINVLVWTVPLVYLGIITTRLLLKNNDSRGVFIRQTLVALINIGLNVLLIPHYGIVGSAWATLLAIIIVIGLEVFMPSTRWIFWLKIKAILFIK